LVLIIFVDLDATCIHPSKCKAQKDCRVQTTRRVLEVISKIGFWFKIPSSPREKRGFAETGAAGPSFPAKRDFPSDQIPFVGRKPQATLLVVEDLKRGTNMDIGPKDIFEVISNIRFMNASYKNKIPDGSLPHG